MGLRRASFGIHAFGFGLAERYERALLSLLRASSGIMDKLDLRMMRTCDGSTIQMKGSIAREPLHQTFIACRLDVRINHF